MSISWFYRKLVDSYLNKSPFCPDNDKGNKSESCTKYDGLINLKSSADSANQWKKTPMFKKKCVFYFSPANFTNDEASTLDSLYKFYLQTLQENDARYNNDTKSIQSAKAIENEEDNSIIHVKKQNVEEKSVSGKYTTRCPVSENQCMFPFTNQHFVSTLNQETFDILHYYLIFPFYISKKVFDMDSSDNGYYCVRFQDAADKIQSTPDIDSHDIDIYSVDDQTYDNFCLQIEEEFTENPQSGLMPTLAELQTEDIRMNSDYDQNNSFLISEEVYKPYYTLEGEFQPNNSIFTHYETRYKDNETGSSFLNKYFVNVKMDKENDKDESSNIKKFISSLDLEKYDFLCAKLLRKLATVIEVKLKDKESKTDD